ncbi:MAG: hypothetical protein AAGD34_10990, partial [Pseudomonadota bacterium]
GPAAGPRARSRLRGCKGRYDLVVDFELADAVERLKSDGVAKEVDGAITFMTIPEAADTYEALQVADLREDAAHICDPDPDGLLVES